MKIRAMTLTTIVTATLAVAAAMVWAEISTQDVVKIASVLRPYQVLSGQTSANEFEVIYVLDNEGRKLAVLKYDVSNHLVPFAGRQLDKDFNSSNGGPYSMVTTQMSGNTGMLYVTDAASHRALAYHVDLTNNKVEPQTPVDLRKLFND